MIWQSGLDIALALLQFLLVIGVLGGLSYCVVKLAPFLIDGKFCPEGVDVVIFGGSLRVFRVKRENIRDAIILKRVGFLRVSLAKPELNNPLAVNVVNRWQDTAILIKTNGLMWWYFSPADPHAALSALRIHH